MFDAWLGAALLLFLVLGVVRSIVAWLIFKDLQQQRHEWLKLQPKASPLMKYDSRPAQRWNSRHARRSRQHERHAAHWGWQQSDR